MKKLKNYKPRTIPFMLEWYDSYYFLIKNIEYENEKDRILFAKTHRFVFHHLFESDDLLIQWKRMHRSVNDNIRNKNHYEAFWRMIKTILSDINPTMSSLFHKMRKHESV